jgi:ribosomal protein S27E
LDVSLKTDILGEKGETIDCAEKKQTGQKESEKGTTPLEDSDVSDTSLSSVSMNDTMLPSLSEHGRQKELFLLNRLLEEAYAKIACKKCGNPDGWAFLPCNHYNICHDCFATTAKCPICSETF